MPDAMLNFSVGWWNHSFAGLKLTSVKYWYAKMDILAIKSGCLKAKSTGICLANDF